MNVDDFADELEGAEAGAGGGDAADKPSGGAIATFGESVTYYRERARLSQSALARATGLSQATISLIEAGERMPSVANAHAIAKALGVSLDVLVGDQVDGFAPHVARFAQAFNALPPFLQSQMEEYMDFLRIRRDKSDTDSKASGGEPGGRVTGVTRDGDEHGASDTGSNPRAPGRVTRRPRR